MAGNLDRVTGDELMSRPQGILEEEKEDDRCAGYYGEFVGILETHH